MIPPRANRSSLRDYDRQLYGERHLIENFLLDDEASTDYVGGVQRPQT